MLDADFPDPDVLRAGGFYHLYATNDRDHEVNVRVARSRDLKSWEILPDAMPQLPAWARPGKTWAPEVAKFGERFVLYFTARHDRLDHQVIGVAVADRPEGPFRAHGEGPLLTETDLGGVIDAATFADDDGSRWLLWKNDGNSRGDPTWIFLQRLSADGLRLEGERSRLIRNDLPWEGPLVEAPTLWKREGRYHLFYSANVFSTRDYAVGRAVADRIEGPYVKQPGPFLAGAGTRPAPGGQDVVEGPGGGTLLIFHIWKRSASGWGRPVQSVPLVWKDGIPAVGEPTPPVPPSPADTPVR